MVATMHMHIKVYTCLRAQFKFTTLQVIIGLLEIPHDLPH